MDSLIGGLLGGLLSGLNSGWMMCAKDSEDGSGRLAHAIAQEMARQGSSISNYQAGIQNAYGYRHHGLAAQQSGLANCIGQAQTSNSQPAAWYRLGDCYVFEYANGRSETRCAFCFQEWKAGHSCQLSLIDKIDPPIEISDEIKQIVMYGMLLAENEYQDDILKREFSRLEHISRNMSEPGAHGR